MTRPARTPPSLEQPLHGPELSGAKRRMSEAVLRLPLRNDAGHWTLAPEGEIDLSNADVLEQAIGRAEASAASTVTIDLSLVDFIDLSGVRAILNAYDRLEGRLRLVEGPAPVQAVFRLTGREDGLPFGV